MALLLVVLMLLLATTSIIPSLPHVTSDYSDPPTPVARPKGGSHMVLLRCCLRLLVWREINEKLAVAEDGPVKRIAAGTERDEQQRNREVHGRQLRRGPAGG